MNETIIENQLNPTNEKEKIMSYTLYVNQNEVEMNDDLRKIIENYFLDQNQEQHEQKQKYENIIISHFKDWNFKRYSRPWVARVTAVKQYDFFGVGVFDGDEGEEGDLIVFQPSEKTVYCVGQKDYRKPHHTYKEHFIFADGEFKGIKDSEVKTYLAKFSN